MEIHGYRAALMMEGVHGGASLAAVAPFYESPQNTYRSGIYVPFATRSIVQGACPNWSLPRLVT